MKPEEYINKSVKVTKLTSAFYSQVGVVKNLTVKGNLDVEFPDERRQLFQIRLLIFRLTWRREAKLIFFWSRFYYYKFRVRVSVGLRV